MGHPPGHPGQGWSAGGPRDQSFADLYAFFGASAYDLPGYGNPNAQGEAVYNQMVQDTTKAWRERPSTPKSNGLGGIFKANLATGARNFVLSQPPLQLTYTTVSGGPTSQPWDINFVLSRASVQGGFVVQHITAWDISGTQSKNFWEAWRVDAGSSVLEGHEYGADDTWGPGWPVGSMIIGEARFYEGIGLGISFSIGGAPNGGVLLGTTVDPHLPTYKATNAVTRIMWVPKP